jgi:PHP family Zn ribbon phosphoesterase
MRAYYDPHIHSCPSPCGDSEMSPINIVNMAKLKKLYVIALTDHNSSKNCPAFLSAAKKTGIQAIPGMELCTAEECHVICLFPNLRAALEFDAVVEATLPDIQNRPEIFGEQVIVDADESAIGAFPTMLTADTSIGIDEISGIVRSLGGIAFPAHIDRPSYSVISVLGTVLDAGFSAFEVSDHGSVKTLPASYPILKDRPILLNSDAHRLEDISEPAGWIELDTLSPEGVISALLAGCAWGV